MRDFLSDLSGGSRVGSSGPCSPVRSGSGTPWMSPDVRRGEASASAVHHHLRGKCHQGNAEAGKRYGNKHKRGQRQPVQVN